jgi:MFS family permease
VNAADRSTPTSPRVGYRRVIRDRWMLVAFATFAYWFAAHGLRPLLPLHLDELGASDSTIGLVVALFPLASLGLAIPSGRLVDRVGSPRIVSLGFVGMIATGLAFTMATTVGAVAVGVVGLGLVELAVWVALQAFASSAGDGEFRIRFLAIFSFAWGLGVALGPLAGARLYEAAGFTAVAIGYAATSIVALLILAGAPRVQDPVADAPGRLGMWSGAGRLWQSAPIRLTLVSSYVVLFIYGVNASFLPLLLERRGLPVSAVGTVLASVGVSSLAVRLALPALQRRLGARRALLLSMWLGLVPMALMPAVDGYGWWLVLALVCGLGLGMNPPITVELMARHTTGQERGLAMGMRLTANRVSQVTQPIVFGAAIPIVGFSATFAGAGAVLAAVTGWAHRIEQPSRAGRNEAAEPGDRDRTDRKEPG